jgi:transposase
MGIMLTVYKWVTSFSGGRASVTDEERSGRPAKSRTEENTAKVRQTVRGNRRLTARSVAEQVNVDRETVRKILTENLDMRKVGVELLPLPRLELLTLDRPAHRR